jgi:heme exporter protein B
MALFSVTVFVLFHFGLDRNEIDGSLASGVLWVTLLLATVLAVTRLFAAERDDGALDGILLAPIDRTAVYFAKAAALFLYLVLLELIALPAFGILLLGPDLTNALPELLAIVALADVGLAGVGALVAGLASETRVRDVIVPLLLLPLLVPVLIAAANATKPLLMLNPATTDLGKWLGFMALYDMVFVLLAVAVFDFLLED